MGAVAAVTKPFITQKISQPAPTPAPTVAEVSQSTATSMDGYDARKTKRKGRSSTIITGAMGVQEQELTLGKKSLLGQ
jgi:hypothetical protein